MTFTDNFNDQLIVKDMMNVDSVIQLEIFNQGTNVSNEFNLSIANAEAMMKELQNIINCHLVGV